MIDEAERLEALHNKRELESRAADILEGRITIKERGPLEFRPELPDGMRGYLFRNARDNRRHTRETEDEAQARRKRAEDYNAHLRRLYGLD